MRNFVYISSTGIIEFLDVAANTGVFVPTERQLRLGGLCFHVDVGSVALDYEGACAYVI